MRPHIDGQEECSLSDSENCMLNPSKLYSWAVGEVPVPPHLLLLGVTTNVVFHTRPGVESVPRNYARVEV